MVPRRLQHQLQSRIPGRSFPPLSLTHTQIQATLKSNLPYLPETVLCRKPLLFNTQQHPLHGSVANVKLFVGRPDL